MPAGRPSKYKPEYCQSLIEHMSEGLSFESYAGLCDCSIDTLYEWAKVQSEFSEAKRIGASKSMLFWERLGLDGARGIHDKFNASTWIYTMKCRFPRHWSDKQEVNHVIADRRETKALPDEDLDQLLIEGNSTK